MLEPRFEAVCVEDVILVALEYDYLVIVFEFDLAYDAEGIVGPDE